MVDMIINEADQNDHSRSINQQTKKKNFIKKGLDFHE